MLFVLARASLEKRKENEQWKGVGVSRGGVEVGKKKKKKKIEAAHFSRALKFGRASERGNGHASVRLRVSTPVLLLAASLELQLQAFRSLLPFLTAAETEMGLAAAAAAAAASAPTAKNADDDTASAAAPSKTHEFLWTATVEPHAARRKAILAAHGDEVRKLYGYDVSTAVQVRGKRKRWSSIGGGGEVRQATLSRSHVEQEDDLSRVAPLLSLGASFCFSFCGGGGGLAVRRHRDAWFAR